MMRNITKKKKQHKNLFSRRILSTLYEDVEQEERVEKVGFTKSLPLLCPKLQETELDKYQLFDRKVQLPLLPNVQFNRQSRNLKQRVIESDDFILQLQKFRQKQIIQ